MSHPIPDIPVIGSFYSDGNASIVVEIDPRSFAEDPESIPFITEKTFKDLPDSNKSDLIQKAEKMIGDAFDLRFGETPWFLPDFDLSFTEKDGGDFSEENIVVIEGRHNTFLETNASFYQIRSKEDAPYDLIFTNQINGKPQRRVNVLFPMKKVLNSISPSLMGNRLFNLRSSKSQKQLLRKVWKNEERMHGALSILLPGRDLFMFYHLGLITSCSCWDFSFYQENGNPSCTKSQYSRLLTPSPRSCYFGINISTITCR